MSKQAEQPDAVGWYDDPEGHKGVERYWNGTAWSGAPRQKPPALTFSAIAMMLGGTVVLTVLVWWLIFS
jgi:hypothetical protein